MTSAIVFTLLLLISGVEPAAGAANADQERQRQQSVAAMAPAKAKHLNVVVGTDKPATAALHREPLLRWSNSTAGSIYGEVYTWSVNGRPAAISSIYRWFDPYQDSTVEMVSLSESPVEVREDNTVVWRSGANGLTFEPMPKASVPAATQGRRLTQMRELAHRFSSELADDRGGDVVTRDLRLLNQPLLRYASEKDGIVDGAIFAFVEATDPEGLLLLEAIKQDNQLQWRFAVARMNAHGLKISRDGTVIKSWTRVTDPIKDPKATYVYFNFDPNLVSIDKPLQTSP